jgi:hypothetical protein
VYREFIPDTSLVSGLKSRNTDNTGTEAVSGLKSRNTWRLTPDPHPGLTALLRACYSFMRSCGG